MRERTVILAFVLMILLESLEGEWKLGYENGLGRKNKDVMYFNRQKGGWATVWLRIKTLSPQFILQRQCTIIFIIET